MKKILIVLCFSLLVACSSDQKDETWATHSSGSVQQQSASVVTNTDSIVEDNIVTTETEEVVPVVNQDDATVSHVEEL